MWQLDSAGRVPLAVPAMDESRRSTQIERLIGKPGCVPNPSPSHLSSGSVTPGATGTMTEWCRSFDSSRVDQGERELAGCHQAVDELLRRLLALDPRELGGHSALRRRRLMGGGGNYGRW